MEFGFNVEKLLKPDNNGVVILNGRQYSSYSAVPTKPLYSDRFGRAQNATSTSPMSQVAEIIDHMGEASSKAQKLPQTITSMARFAGTNQRMYLRVSGTTVQGLLKVGERTIFYRDYGGRCKELNPLCVLDFYVHESLQRQGIGLQLFHCMLQNESIYPNKIAYDKPSPKLLKFLEKYYGLKAFVPQNNNYVIYEAFWNRDYSIPKKTIEITSDQDYQKPKEKEVYSQKSIERNPRETDRRETHFAERDAYKQQEEVNAARVADHLRLLEEEQAMIEKQLRQEQEDVRKLQKESLASKNRYFESQSKQRESEDHNSKFDKKRNTVGTSPFNDYNQEKYQQRTSHTHVGFPGQGRQVGVPQYGGRNQMQREEPKLPSLNKQKPQDFYDLVPPLLPDPIELVKPHQRKVTTYDRELNSLE